MRDSDGKYVPNGDTCRSGLHPWPESRVVRGGVPTCRECAARNAREYKARQRALIPIAEPPADREWREVLGCEGRYLVSEYGDVWAIARPGRPGGGPRLAQKRGPYWKVDLALGSRTEVRESRVHELVAAAFLGPKPEWAECVRHLDDNPDNNHVSNLAYGTHADNSRDRIVNGRTVQAKLTDAQVAAIVADSRFQRVIAQDYGVSVSIISQIKRGVWSGQRRKETQ